MSKFRYTKLIIFVFVCLFGLPLVACANGQVSMPTLPPTSQPLPDLVIVDVALDSGSTTLCDTAGLTEYDFRVEVANIGEEGAGQFQVSLGKSLSPFGALRPGEKTSIIIHGVHGRTTFLKDSGIEVLEQKVVIDSGNEVLELDESNNTFLVREQIPPCITAPDLTPIPEPGEAQEPEQKLIELYPSGQPVIIDSLYMIDAVHGWAIAGEVDQAQHVLRTSDGGQTWADVTPPQTITINDSSGRVLHGEATGFFLNAETAWVIFHTFRWDDTGTLWRTQDGGRSWEPSWRLPILTFGAISSYPELEFVDAQHGWLDIGYFLGAGSGRDELFVTIDGGQTWELVVHERSNQWANWVRGPFYGMDFVDPLHGWAASKHNSTTLIHWTSDGGHTWRLQELPAPGSACSEEVASIASPTLFSSQFGMLNVFCDSIYLDPFNPPDNFDFLYVTTDGGKNWQMNPLPSEQSEIEFQVPERSIDIINSNLLYLLKTKLREDRSEHRVADLYMSRDRGRSWKNVTTVGWYGALEFVDERVGWAVVRNEPDEYGIERFLMLMHTSDGGQTWEQLFPQSVSEAETPRWGTLPPQIKLPDNLAILVTGNAQEMNTLAEVPVDVVTDIVFGSDGKLATAQRNGWLTLWDTNGLEYPMTLHAHKDWVYDVKFYGKPNAYGIASVSKDGSLFFRWVHNAQFADDMSAGEITSVAFSPGAQDVFASTIMAISSEKDWAVRTWKLEFTSLEELRTLKGHTDWVWDVTFSPDGSTLASASSDATVRLWNPASGETLHVLNGHNSTVWRVEFSPDGRILASASWDGTVKLWDVSTGEELATLRGHKGPVYGIAFSPDGKLLASGSADGTVQIWDVAQTKLLTVLRGHTGPVRSIAFDPEGDILASASDDGTVKFWGVVP